MLEVWILERRELESFDWLWRLMRFLLDSDVLILLE